MDATVKLLGSHEREKCTNRIMEHESCLGFPHMRMQRPMHIHGALSMQILGEAVAQAL
jgi:hypothetical protein